MEIGKFLNAPICSSCAEVMNYNEIDCENCERLVYQEINSRVVVRGGCTRQVLLIGRLAIKIPRVNRGWGNFLRGLLGNIQEKTINKMYLHTGKIAPIYVSLWGGFLIVMPRCKPLTPRDYSGLDYSVYKNSDIPVEDKRDSFGWYKGGVVAIDYGS